MPSLIRLTALAAMFALAIALALSSCSDRAALPESAGMGANPILPEPKKSLIPTANPAKATGWEEGAMPTAASGLKVQAFADRLSHPRWLHVLPNGDVLVAETNAPPKPEDNKGVRGFFMKMFMTKAGATSSSANRITLLRDTDGDGIAETRSTLLENLNSPFGMALVGDQLYIANTDAMMRFPYKQGQMRISDPGTRLTDLPGGDLNHHWTKSLVASPDGSKLYVGVGSNSNAAENGLDKEEGRAAIWEIDRASGKTRVFATGLRNPVGLAFERRSGQLWAVVNERDELGSDLVPDYMTAVKDGGFYGWPFSYFGAHVDERVKPQRPDLVATAIAPDYALGAHTAPLGLAFGRSGNLPRDYASGAFVGLHGSWNRRPHSGYKVIFVPFANGRPNGDPIEVLTGFLDGKGNTRGRPVGVALDRQGAVLVADDVGNRVWRVSSDRPLVGAQRR
jgi:glucose/arabinose dehydrogenase